MDRTEPRLVPAVEHGVATVVIANPAKRNAMTPAMWRSLPELLEGLAADPAVRVLVLTGAGDTFCAGADISTLREGADTAQELAVAAEEALAAFPRPTLAAVRGFCVGGGSQLAAACDLRFAEEGASFGVTPAKLGIVYPASSTRRLVSLVGPATAKHLLFSGELIGTERALRTGLADEVLLRAAWTSGSRSTYGRWRPAPGSPRPPRRSSPRAGRTGTRTGLRRGAAATRRRASPPSWSGARPASPTRRGEVRRGAFPYAAARAPAPVVPSGRGGPTPYRALSASRARHSSTRAAGAFSGEPLS